MNGHLYRLRRFHCLCAGLGVRGRDTAGDNLIRVPGDLPVPAGTLLHDAIVNYVSHGISLRSLGI